MNRHISHNLRFPAFFSTVFFYDRSSDRSILIPILFAAILAWTSCRCSAQEAERVTLPDGVRLILKPEATAENVAISLFIRTGRDAGLLENAVGEVVAHGLLHGSTDRRPESLAFTIAQVGGSLETLRTPDYVAVTWVTVPNQADDAMNMLGEVLKHADFGPEALKRACTEIMSARAQRTASPFRTAAARVSSALNGNSEADEQLLKLVTSEQAQFYFHTRYVPAETVISVAGRFRQDTVITAFSAYLNEYDRMRPRPLNHTRSESSYNTTAKNTTVENSTPQNSEARNLEVKNLEAKTTAIDPMRVHGAAAYALIGITSPTIDSPDYPAFEVLHALLGSGHASRLFHRIRDTLGLAYRIGAIYQSDRSEPMIAYLQWDALRSTGGVRLSPEAALRHLQNQLDGLTADPPSEAEVLRARNIAIGQEALRNERVRDHAYMCGWYETMDLGYDYDFQQHLAKVTTEDLLRVAARYLGRRAEIVALPDAATH